MSENSPIRKWLKAWPWLAAILSGLLTTLCFAPFEQTWLCWIALTPLLAAIWFSGEGAKRRWLRDLLLGYVAGVAFFWTVFSWLHTVTVPGLVLVGLYMGVYFAIWGWIAGLVRPRPITDERECGERPTSSVQRSAFHWEMRCLTSRRKRARPGSARCTIFGSRSSSPPTWTALEWVRGWMFTGWGWNGLGVALHKILPIIQIAEVTGVAGLSFLVAFANVIAIATVRRFLLETKLRKRRPHFDFTLTMAAIVGLAAYGIRALQVKSATEPLRVAAVQADVPREEKFSPAFEEKIFQQFTRLTQIALATRPPPQLIIWPESSTPAPALVDAENYRFVMDLAASIKTDLLLGTIDVDEKGDYNAAILVPEWRAGHPGLSQAASRAVRRICARAKHGAVHRGNRGRPGAGRFYPRERAGGFSPDDGSSDGGAADLFRRHAR